MTYEPRELRTVSNTDLSPESWYDLITRDIVVGDIERIVEYSIDGNVTGWGVDLKLKDYYCTRLKHKVG